VDFPNDRAISRRFRSTANMVRQLAEWAGADESRTDVAAMLAGRFSEPEPDAKRSSEGFVYLIKWGVNQDRARRST